jgi:two-component system chemotaxis sensor kinase CheA
MSQLTAIVEASNLTEQLDELATRLLVDGAASLTAEDFRSLSEIASELGNPAFASAASKLEAVLDRSSREDQNESMAVLSAGLDQLRSLADPANSPAQAPAQATPLATATTFDQNGPLSADEDLIREFITESLEHLVNIEGQMLILEKNAGDAESAETLNAVFRAFHTIKGLAGFLEFDAIRALAHEVETLLDLCRNGKLQVTSPIVDIILESADVMRNEVNNITLRLDGNTPPVTMVNDALLERIRKGCLPDEQATAIPLQTEAPTAIPFDLSEPEILTPEVQPPPSATAKSTPPPPPAQSRQENNGSTSQAIKAAEGVVMAPVVAERRAADSGSVRIDTGKLDQLMDMVGEMVIAQTLIGHSETLKKVSDARFLADLTQLARITADVQRITTGMRMVPIGLQFQKTARVIRDLSRRAGKQIVFEMSGEDTEVDKTIAEEISDPLLHMVRNSIDHGIETPAERIAAGKDATAHIRLAAYHQSGQIVISISDDGRGLNREKIINKATERGLIAPGAQLTDSDAFLLIFEAGFSTAEKITDISGRGVGMDVVRRHVQALRGRIDIQSTAGEGTTFFLKLPLTLAIIEGLVVVVGDQRYVAPIFSVKEMFRPTADQLSTVHGTSEMVMVRGGLLPIVRLHKRFNKEPRTAVLTEGTLIVAEAEGHQFCLFVDDLVGKQEVVIKSLGNTFSHVVGIAGCAILGDGRVGLILDMHGIFKGKI